MKETNLVVVTTAPRSDVSYLQDTLESLDRSGARSLPRLLVSDGFKGRGPEVPIGWERVNFNVQQGAKKTLWTALYHMLATRAQKLLFFEDDVCACQNAVDQMVAQPVPEDAAFLSYFDLGVAFASAGVERIEPGIYKYPLYAFMSACALVFPRRTAEYLVSVGVPELDWCGIHDRDTALNHLLKRSPWPQYGLYMPSLVQHMGEVSAARIGDRRIQQAPSYLGDNFDAFTLPIYRTYAGTLIVANKSQLEADPV